MSNSNLFAIGKIASHLSLNLVYFLNLCMLLLISVTMTKQMFFRLAFLVLNWLWQHNFFTHFSNLSNLLFCTSCQINIPLEAKVLFLLKAKIVLHRNLPHEQKLNLEGKKRRVWDKNDTMIQSSIFLSKIYFYCILAWKFKVFTSIAHLLTFSIFWDTILLIWFLVFL